MKIIVQHTAIPENEVILRCPALDEEMLGILTLLGVWDEARTLTLIAPDQVVYCESVDDRVFVYTQQTIYHTALSLGELESRYASLGFVRIGRPVLVNLHHIRTLKSRPGGRVEILLETGEKLMASRHYAPLLRERLGL